MAATNTNTNTSSSSSGIDFTRLILFPIKAIGHLLSVGILLTGAFWIWVIDSSARAAVKIIACLSFASVDLDSKVIHGPRSDNSENLVFVEGTDVIGGLPGQGNQIIDEEATLAKIGDKKGELSTDEMMEKVKLLLRTEFGAKQPSLLADDFQFIFPVVGPLSKEEFVTAFSSFKVFEAFPEGNGRYFGFTRDPLEPNRVWLFSRARLVHEGTLNFGPQKFPPTGKEVLTVPQVLSCSFDGDGKLYKFTGGYSVDRSAGNTGGLGGVFGIVHALGGQLPFPEGRPWLPSLQWEALAKRLPQIGLDFVKTGIWRPSTFQK